MPAHTKPKLITAKERCEAVDYLRGFVSRLPDNSYETVGTIWNVPPDKLKRSVNLAVTVLLADCGNKEARKAISDLEFIASMSNGRQP